jgi:hypothetical protein
MQFCWSGQRAEKEGECEEGTAGKGNGQVEEGWRKRQMKR